MGLLISTEELFNIAAQIEAGGQAFYLEVSSNAADPDLKELYDQLAAEEARHYNLFVDLYRQVSGSDSALPQVDPETASYIEAILNLRIFRNSKDGQERAFLIKSVGEALASALQFEKDTLLFFHELTRLISPELCSPINALIAEERKHIAKLNDRYEASK